MTCCCVWYEDIDVTEQEVPQDTFNNMMESIVMDRRFVSFPDKKGYHHVVYRDSRIGFIKFIPESTDD